MIASCVGNENSHREKPQHPIVIVFSYVSNTYLLLRIWNRQRYYLCRNDTSCVVFGNTLQPQILLSLTQEKVVLFAIINLAHVSRQEICIHNLNFHMEKSVSTIWISQCDSLGKFFFTSSSVIIFINRGFETLIWVILKCFKLFLI